MPHCATVAIIGDHDRDAATHRATEDALDQTATALGAALSRRWVSTRSLEPDARAALDGASGVWVAPGSPYASMAGALAGIRHARESGVPLLGTCGGFQHVVIEYARHVLGFADAQHAEYDPGASTLFVTPLACSVIGAPLRVLLEPGSRTAAWYGAAEAEERYHCQFGLDPARQDLLHQGGLRIAGRDEDGEARVLELPDHPFYVATLFLPQTRSTPERPHPLVAAFVRAAAQAGRPGEADYAQQRELV
jgi:CTP synthase (UTP-ammonia lyase)